MVSVIAVRGLAQIRRPCSCRGWYRAGWASRAEIGDSGRPVTKPQAGSCIVYKHKLNNTLVWAG